MYEASFGYENWEPNVPHSPLTKFRIALVTKSFTVAVLMVLEGRVERIRFQRVLDGVATSPTWTQNSAITEALWLEDAAEPLTQS